MAALPAPVLQRQPANPVSPEAEAPRDEPPLGQASSTVLSQRLLSPPLETRIEGAATATDAKQARAWASKAKGTANEVRVPFALYADAAWNHIGGGSETASSRTSLARRSSHNERSGAVEGTSGLDFIVHHRGTDRLVLGEQKATQGREFSGATAITTSLADNVARSAQQLRLQIEQGRVHPQEVAGLRRIIARLDATHAALVNPRNDTRLPDGVVFELTNLGGGGQVIGNAHIKLLAKKYGHAPAFVEHLLSRSFVRDAALAKAHGRPADGQVGTDADPSIVPAEALLNGPARDTLARLKSGMSPARWKKLKARQAKQARDQAAADRKLAQQAAAAARAAAKTEAKAQRAAAKKQLEREARQAGERARKQSLKDSRAQRQRSAEPPRGPQARKALTEAHRRADERLADKAAKAAARQHVVDHQEREARIRDAGVAAAKEQREQASEARRAERAHIAAEKKALAEALARVEAQPTMTPDDWGRLPRADRQRLEAAAAHDPKLAARLNRKVNAQQTQDWKASAQQQNAEIDARNAQPQKRGTQASRTARGMNLAAAGVRAYDAFANARDQGKGGAEALFDAGKTYLENTNQVLGAVATMRGRMQTETLPDGRTQQLYGEDAGDAFFGTLGENLAGALVPGRGWDQLVNAGANLVGAVDDHVHRGEEPADPAQAKATLRTGTDLAAELTPSRMFASTVGAGMRAWYDVGKALGGRTSGVDKFADDAVRGKLGSVLQPVAMAADFVGELGGSDAGTALERTLGKTKGTTLTKLGEASGEAMFDLGQNRAAKAGQYGGLVQTAATVLSVTTDLIAGQSFHKAIDNAAADGSTDARLVKGVRDVASSVGQQASGLWNQGLPAARQRLVRWWQ